MKELKIKISALLIVFVILLSTLLIVLPKNEISANAESDIAVSDMSQANEQAISECKFVQASFDEQIMDKLSNSNEFVGYVESELEKVESSVVDVLHNQKKQYEALLADETDAERLANIESLINSTEQLIMSYENEKLSTIAESDNNTYYASVVSAAIAYFKVNGYELSAELLARMSTNKSLDATYRPIHSYRIMSSDLIYSLALGSETSGGRAFEKDVYNDEGDLNEYYDDSTNGKDLYYAIHNFDFYKTTANSRVVTITDRYDYGNEDYDGIQNGVISQLYKLQEAGYLISYQVSISLDTKSYLRVENLGHASDGWKIRISNYDTVWKTVFYNRYMCFGNDANGWTGLRDIQYTYLPANESIEVIIYPYLTATHIAISSFENTTRYITYADCLGESSITPYVKNMFVATDDNVQLLGKNGNKWLVRVVNRSAQSVKVEYNRKMCFEADAINWSLKDVTTISSLGAYEKRIIEIEENFAATHIAIRFTDKTGKTIYYANQLNENCSMNLSTNYKYLYLVLSVSRKSGNTWYINITNPTESDLTVYYNRKMCFNADAANWANLNDQSNVLISAGKTKTVAIQENWFATSIAISYVKNDKRVISYADGLNTNGSINLMYNQF